MEIEIEWEYTDEEEESIDFNEVLYAYLNPHSDEILYIGKADRSSVWERMKGEHKEDVFDFIQNELGLNEFSCIVGVPDVPAYGDLLADIESLLIYCIKPSANIQSKNSRISRPELSVTCSGDWPYKESQFYDD
ncbi:MAG: hypothetical protein KME37_09750 [Candidatus Thiodiazotropha sp. (ex Codakia orbicularis)]|nr:hypothetical protein [Candidatus Thiodiazotropha sp. (ex Codakia orbicularis)]